MSHTCCSIGLHAICIHLNCTSVVLISSLIPLTLYTSEITVETR